MRRGRFLRNQFESGCQRCVRRNKFGKCRRGDGGLWGWSNGFLASRLFEG